VFSPDEDSRSFFSNLTSTLIAGIPLVIAFVMVFRYKRGMKMQQDKSQLRSKKGTDITNYYDNNKMHLSICIFLVLWFVAHIIWTFQFQQSSDVAIQDILWFIGYGFFGYFLYSLYYHFFRKELEPLILILIAIIISTALVFVLDTIVSIMRLLSTQTLDFYVLLVTLAYPILDAIMIFPAILIFWAVRRVSSERINSISEQKIEATEEDKSSSTFPVTVSSIWILLLSISMILPAIGDTGFAYSTAYGPDTAQRDVWIWDIFYNSSGLCLATALIGYRHFFSFTSVDTLQH
jgi:ABC-type multidrug transport system fused ATPase/permease subunit